ncbi:MAG: helix-turn-helix transcriptional regulator [Clostridia bacterium]|nr:helix-turn-helix transcriptional regulator [Clostridia bacterium]
MQTAQRILNYIHYLKEKIGFSVSIHFHMAPASCILRIMGAFREHEGAYCVYISQNNNEVHNKCLECQRKAVSKVRKSGAFSGVCHAGVFEYVYPVTINGKTDGILCVSGYAAENKSEYIDKLEKVYGLDRRVTQTTYSTLETNIPSKEDVDVLIYPLLSMIELLSYEDKIKNEPSTPLSEKILEHCRWNFLKKITTEDICNKFFCSRSYVAHMFKKETGKSLPEYINFYRIKTAKHILKTTDAGITEVATLSGFEDRGYFSKCFKKETGLTPREWRKQNKKGM